MSKILTITKGGIKVSAKVDHNGYVHAREYLEKVNDLNNDDKSLAEFFRNKSTKDECVRIESDFGVKAYKVYKQSRKGVNGSVNDIVMMQPLMFDFFTEWLDGKVIYSVKDMIYFRTNLWRKFVNFIYSLFEFNW